MKITPFDIQKQQFSLRFRGFDVQEVDTYLSAVADEFKDLTSENDTLKAEVGRLEEELLDYRGREKTLEEALVSAQRMSESMREDARRKADLVIAEAKVAAEKMLGEAHQRLTRLHHDLSELQRQYVQFQARIRAAVEAHVRLLDTVRDDAATASDEPAALGGSKSPAFGPGGSLPTA